MIDRDPSSFGAWLQRQRRARGWTQEELAERAGLSVQAISVYERSRKLPHKETFARLAEALALGAAERKRWWNTIQQERSQRTTSLDADDDSVFHFNERLPDPGEFYGRVRERETLLSRTRRGACTSIVGLRRIGKTWLLDYLRLVVRERLGASYRIGYLDATQPSCASEAGFSASALAALGGAPEAGEVPQGLASLERVVRSLRARQQVPVLSIDEFEGFGNRDAFDLAFFASLRALTQLGLALVVASKRPLIEVIGEYGATSGLFNVFEQCRLTPFTDGEAEAFIAEKSAAARFTPEEQERFHSYGKLPSGYLPIRLQLVGTLLLTDKRLAENGNSEAYHPADPDYWQGFEARLEDAYRGVIADERFS
jgi:transcriptional regulator with XRE-family HTH domain